VSRGDGGDVKLVLWNTSSPAESGRVWAATVGSTTEAVEVSWEKAVAEEVWRSPGLTHCASPVVRTLSPEAEGVATGNGVPDDIPNSAVSMETDNAAVG
jgi:hypothetical protein